jgi:tRNA dimethylallyltransferase
MLSNPRRVIAVVGPTCTGKSELALNLASRYNGEIVNADSMQVYRHFNIGTAKPDADALNRVPHHLIDIVEPGDEFNAALFKEKADEAIDAIWARGRTPIFVGGTGLYVRALVYGLFKAPTEGVLRDELKRAYEEDPQGFFEELKEIDRAYAMRINSRDKVRSVRAMEVYRLTGKTMSDLEKEQGFGEALYNIMKIGLERKRDDLYRRINLRVEEMLGRGWVEEVRAILSMGYSQFSKPFSGIGYRDILRHINGEVAYEDMVESIKKQTRHYAKRQLTWFSREKDLYWFAYPEEKEIITQRISEFLGIWN